MSTVCTPTYFATAADRIAAAAAPDLGARRPVASLQARQHSPAGELGARRPVGAGAQPGDAARRHHRARHGPVDPHRLRHHRLFQGGRRAHLQGRAVRGAGGAIHLCARCAVEIRHRPAGGDERDPHPHRRPDRPAHPRPAGRRHDAEGRSAPVADVCPPSADIRLRRDGRHRRRCPPACVRCWRRSLPSASARSSWRSPPISRSPFCRSARSIGRWPSSRPRTTSSGVRTCCSIRPWRTWSRGWRCSTPRRASSSPTTATPSSTGSIPRSIRPGTTLREIVEHRIAKGLYAGRDIDDVVREMRARVAAGT